MTFNLKDAQARQKAWSKRNFPDRRGGHSILGILEEAGEGCQVAAIEDDLPPSYRLVMDLGVYVGRLAHINLKRAQGIRKASTSFDNECDALDQLLRLVTEYGQVIGYPPTDDIEPEIFEPSVEKEQDALADIGVYILDRCARMGWDYQEILDRVLEEVLRRDWVKDPKLGGTAA